MQTQRVSTRHEKVFGTTHFHKVDVGILLGQSLKGGSNHVAWSTPVEGTLLAAFATKHVECRHTRLHGSQ